MAQSHNLYRTSLCTDHSEVRAQPQLVTYFLTRVNSVQRLKGSFFFLWKENNDNPPLKDKHALMDEKQLLALVSFVDQLARPEMRTKSEI